MIVQLLIRLCYFQYFYNTLKYLTLSPYLTLIYNHMYIIYLNIYLFIFKCYFAKKIDYIFYNIFYLTV